MLGAALCAIIGAVYDVRSSRIPNWLTYLGLGMALAIRGLWGGWPGLKQGLWGALLGGGVLFLFFLVRGIGAGDVKLMAAVGAWVGFHGAVTVLIATAFAGGILALVYMVFYKQVVGTFRNLGTILKYHITRGVRPHPKLSLQSSQTIRLPYGLAIAVGTLYLLFSTGSLVGVIYGH
jgi:prepilin peptidase CpaA